MSIRSVTVVGGGLAGCEAAYQLAKNGISVTLHEMRPHRQTPAHQTGNLAELVCSNTFKSTSISNATGILKHEMKLMGSLIMECAEASKIPAGEALGVDRDRFSSLVTDRIRSHPGIRVVEGEVTSPQNGEVTLLSTGPLTSDLLCHWIKDKTGMSDLYFYDAIAPIIDTSSIDFEKCFLANRYDKGEEEAYLNCPLDENEYAAFIEALSTAEKVPPKPFEKEKFYQGCQPIEAIAATGAHSLRHGPMKPVGLVDPRTGKTPYAVVQLRPENKSKTAYNLVGFQTKLKYGEQKRVLSLIPALKNAEFFRLGSVHRNTYLCGPKLLRADLSLKGESNVFFAGQITGVEGYLESSSSGLLASIFILQKLSGLPVLPPPMASAIGSLYRHVVASNPDHYQPSGIHYGIMDPIYFDQVAGMKKDLARNAIAQQSLENIKNWKNQLREIYV